MITIEQTTEEAHLTINVEYDTRTREAKITGTVKPELRQEMLCDFLRSQTGQGVDNREPEEHDVYHVHITWNSDGDVFESRSNTGRLGLRDGILSYVVANHSFEE